MSVDEATVGNAGSLDCEARADSGHLQYGLIRLYRLRADAMKRLAQQPRFKGLKTIEVAKEIEKEWRSAASRHARSHRHNIDLDDIYESLHRAQVRPVSASTIARDLDKRDDDFF